MYYCDHCSYITNRKGNYERHVNKKYKCCDSEQKVDYYKQNSDNSKQKNCDLVKNKTQNVNNCDKCNRSLSSRQRLISHQKICNGLSKLQCEKCHKYFKSSSSKSKHKKNVKCNPSPPSPPPPESDYIDQKNVVSNITNNTNNIDNSNNNDNCIINTQNNNCNIIHVHQYNSFGSVKDIENLSNFLRNEEGIKLLDRMKEYGKKKIYGIREMQNDIFFNKKNPESFNIIKPGKYGTDVRIRNEDGEFEIREFEDVRENILDYFEKFIEEFNLIRKEYDIKFKDDESRMLVKEYLNIMNRLDVYIPDDLKDALSMNYLEDDESLEKYRKFDKISLDNLNIQTEKMYRRKRGTYIIRDDL